jgi:cell division septation protein DedD
MKKILYSILSLLMIFILSSCSATEQTTSKYEKKGEDSVYVFDEVPQDSVPAVKSETPAQNTPSTYYIVQVGAFTTKDKAETFSRESRDKMKHEVIVIYSNTVNLFVVQLTELFSTRAEAENVRNELWKMPEFKDAWILTVTK